MRITKDDDTVGRKITTHTGRQTDRRTPHTGRQTARQTQIDTSSHLVGGLKASPIIGNDATASKQAHISLVELIPRKPSSSHTKTMCRR